jgi:hypothetical protein
MRAMREQLKQELRASAIARRRTEPDSRGAPASASGASNGQGASGSFRCERRRRIRSAMREQLSKADLSA